jgi:hypothetical protein
LRCDCGVLQPIPTLASIPFLGGMSYSEQAGFHLPAPGILPPKKVIHSIHKDSGCPTPFAKIVACKNEKQINFETE